MRFPYRRFSFFAPFHIVVNIHLQQALVYLFSGRNEIEGM